MRRNAVFKRNVLGAQNLFRRHGKERAGLHRGVVGDDHAQPAGYTAESRDNARSGSTAVFVVHAIGSPEAKFEELSVLVEQQIQPLPDGQSPF